MPLNVDDYLEQVPALVALRAGHDEQAIAKAEAEHRRLWEQGAAGWMTVHEGRFVAAMLTEEARQQLRDAKVDVEVNLAGTGGLLVFRGAGRHSLDLACTSPVRAAAHWRAYLPDCPTVPKRGE